MNEATRAFSAAVFNNRYALEVMALVAEWEDPKDRFYTKRLASILGLDSSEVKPVLQRLVDARMIVELPERGTYGAIYFRRVDDQEVFWEYVRRVAETREAPG